MSETAMYPTIDSVVATGWWSSTYDALVAASSQGAHMTLLVLHHDSIVGVDRLEPSLDARDLKVVHVDATSEPLPDTSGLSGILVLGGRQSVAGDDLPDWVDPELDLLRAAQDAEVPVFGLCLGSQLLALANGGRVEPRETPELGMVAVHRTEPGHEDDVTAGWPDGAPCLASHDDEVTRLPDDAVQLLTGSDGATMWRIGTSHATQLHPEASADTFAAWLEQGDPTTRVGIDTDQVLARAHELEAQSRAAGVSLVMRWVDGLDWDTDA